MTSLLPSRLKQQFINAAIDDNSQIIAAIFKTTKNPDLLFFANETKLDFRLAFHPPLISVLCYFGSIKSVRLLLEQHCDPLILDTMNRSIMHFIAMSNSLDLWHEFEYFYNSKSYDYDSINPFGYSLIYNAIDIADYLISQNEDIDILLPFQFKNISDRIRPIHIAAFNGNNDLITLLLSNGADITALSKSGYTILDFSFLGGEINTVNYLLNLGFHINTGNADLHFMNLIVIGGSQDILSAISMNCSLNLRNFPEQFILAASMGRFSMVKFFLQSGLDIDSTSTDNRTALSAAISNGFTKIAKFLIINHSSFDLTLERDFKALEIAIQHQYFNTIIILSQFIPFFFKTPIHSIAELSSSRIYSDIELQHLNSVANSSNDTPQEIVDRILALHNKTLDTKLFTTFTEAFRDACRFPIPIFKARSTGPSAPSTSTPSA
jgi:ankyrin repeat protein